MRKRGLPFLIISGMIFWGYYFLGRGPSSDPSGKTFRNKNLESIQAVIEDYRAKEGAYPGHLIELVEKGYLDELPISGAKSWEYDPSEGRVR